MPKARERNKKTKTTTNATDCTQAAAALPRLSLPTAVATASVHYRTPPAPAFKNPNGKVEVKEATDEETNACMYACVCVWVWNAHTLSPAAL